MLDVARRRHVTDTARHVTRRTRGGTAVLTWGAPKPRRTVLSEVNDGSIPASAGVLGGPTCPTNGLTWGGYEVDGGMALIRGFHGFTWTALSMTGLRQTTA